LGSQADPTRVALFDLTSSWVTGRCCELAARGYSRDGKKGLPQINYGVLTDPEGRPVAVRVFSGNTADPVAFTDIVEVIRTRFGLDTLVLVGDRGMITSARIAALSELNDTGTGFGWITALRAPAIATLAADNGPLQMSLFDQQDLAEITHPDYPGERLIACRNPALAAERTRKRTELLAATETDLAAIAERVARGTLTGAGKIGEAVGRIIAKYKVGKHFHRAITDTSFTYHRNHAAIDAEARLDGIYVLRTSVPAADLDPAEVVAGYKNLAHIERDFRSIKTDDLDLRPIHHRLDERVKAHVLICMLACYLTWHLRKAWAPLTFTDEHPPQQHNPVAPAQRSAHAQAKASRQQDPNGAPLRSFRGLLKHLATLTRNQIRYHGTNTEVPTLAEPTPDQRRAFQLIGTAIPLTAA
ncbi:MAG TPA: IS1634 family transposase, partial [Mycobacterium sp.]|nr:IS1634 family transposase [Mycobacterium sp.]